MTERVMIFIDGSNFYFGLKRFAEKLAPLILADWQNYVAVRESLSVSTIIVLPFIKSMTLKPMRDKEGSLPIWKRSLTLNSS